MHGVWHQGARDAWAMRFAAVRPTARCGLRGPGRPGAGWCVLHAASAMQQCPLQHSHRKDHRHLHVDHEAARRFLRDAPGVRLQALRRPARRQMCRARPPGSARCVLHAAPAVQQRPLQRSHRKDHRHLHVEHEPARRFLRDAPGVRLRAVPAGCRMCRSQPPGAGRRVLHAAPAVRQRALHPGARQDPGNLHVDESQARRRLPVPSRMRFPAVRRAAWRRLCRVRRPGAVGPSLHHASTVPHRRVQRGEWRDQGHVPLKKRGSKGPQACRDFHATPLSFPGSARRKFFRGSRATPLVARC